MSALVARAAIRDYGEHRVVPSRPAFPAPILLETSTRSPGRYTPPRPIHRFQALLDGSSDSGTTGLLSPNGPYTMPLTWPVVGPHASPYRPLRASSILALRAPNRALPSTSPVRHDRTIYQGALTPVPVLDEWMQIRALCAWPAARRPETYGAPIRQAHIRGRDKAIVLTL